MALLSRLRTRKINNVSNGERFMKTASEADVFNGKKRRAKRVVSERRPASERVAAAVDVHGGRKHRSAPAMPQQVTSVEQIHPHSEICEHKDVDAWGEREAWLSGDGEFHMTMADGSTRTMRFADFRTELGFCAAHWLIARPGVHLSHGTATRWGLTSSKAALASTRGARVYVTALFLAARDEDGFQSGYYYGCRGLGAPAAFEAVCIHSLTLESIRVLLAWCRRLHKNQADDASNRAPLFPPDPLQVYAALDAIDAFCIANPGVVIGPTPRVA